MKTADFDIRSFFLGIVFGRLRHPIVSLSLFGQLCEIGFSQVIIWRVGVLTLLIGASCVVAMERQWIIFCYIVRRLIVYGVLSLELLGFRGFSQDWLQIFILVGGIDWEAFF